MPNAECRKSDSASLSCASSLSIEHRALGIDAFSPGLSPPELYDLEVAGRQARKCGIELAVVPARIHRTGDVHVAAVVGDDQPVRLHAAEDVPDHRGIGGQVL